MNWEKNDKGKILVDQSSKKLKSVLSKHHKMRRKTGEGICNIYDRQRFCKNKVMALEKWAIDMHKQFTKEELEMK